MALLLVPRRLQISGAFASSLHGRIAAKTAIMQTIANSPGLTSVSLARDEHFNNAARLPFTMLSDLLAAGSASGSGLASRLRTLVGGWVGADAPQELPALQHCTSLTHLDISYAHLGTWLSRPGGHAAAALAASFKGMRSLTYLRAEHCQLDSSRTVGPMHSFASALRPLTQLQHLHLAKNRIGAVGLGALRPVAAGMLQLQTLDVADCCIQSMAGAQALQDLLCVTPCLTHLCVSGNSIGPQGAAGLASALRGVTCLQSLHIGRAALGDSGVRLLTPVLAALPCLHTLDLSFNELLRWCWLPTLLPAGSTGGSAASPLRTLDVIGNPLVDGDARVWTTVLSAGALQLQSLNLSDTQLWDRGWLELAPALTSLTPSLQALRVSRSVVGPMGEAYLASTLQALTGLTCLEARSFFSSVGMVTVAPYLRGLTRLQVLNLWRTPMRADGTAAFVRVLPALAGSLKHLDLSRCSMDTRAAETVLAPALAQATGLAQLHLNDNELGPRGAQWLPQVLGGMRYLRRVGLSACGLGPEGCVAVAQALKDRDGLALAMHDNAVARGSAVWGELSSMPGLTIHL